MTHDNRIDAFVKLGELFRNFPDRGAGADMEKLRAAAEQAQIWNPWFIQDSIRHAVQSLGAVMTREKLNEWINPYRQKINNTDHPKTVAIVMAGNIPLVGFHDFLSVLITGNKVIAKLSSQDAKLLPAMAEILAGYHSGWNDKITLTSELLPSFDAIIATGSNNSSRYFEFYFGKYPNIIRKNRNSIAIITGDETDEELAGLADDILLYFGMGCRSISKVYIPSGYDLSRLSEHFGKYEQYRYHNKYRNNYDYFKSIYIINRVPFIDTGDILFAENTALASPISVVFYEHFDDIALLSKQIVELESQLQCVVCHKPPGISRVLPGEAQQPELWDYADGINTLDFLTGLV
jgi:hypothetical protein